MQKPVATALLILYVVSSAGVVLADYSCRETGTYGTTVPATQSCYAPVCCDAVSCIEESCCDVDLRVITPGDQILSPKSHDVVGGSSVVVWFEAGDALHSVRPATTARFPDPPFPGFDRPIRI